MTLSPAGPAPLPVSACCCARPSLSSWDDIAEGVERGAFQAELAVSRGDPCGISGPWGPSQLLR